MNYSELMAKSSMSLCLPLEAPATIDRLQRLFEDLFLTARLNPRYLFLTEQDHRALSDDAARSIVDDPSQFRAVRQLLNVTTGHYVHVVTLPDLQENTVVVGFYKL